MRHLRTLAPLTALLALLALPAAAGAATLSIDNTYDDEHSYDADPGEVDNVRVTANGLDGDDEDNDAVTFQSLNGDTIDVDADDQDRCAGTGTSTVTCTGGDVYLVDVELDDMNDTLEARGNFPTDLNGGDGNDVITGTDESTAVSEDDEFVEGGGGDDQILLRGGNDEANGDEGSDTIQGGEGEDSVNDDGDDGNDNYDGGPGFDDLDYNDDGDDPEDTFAVDLSAGRGGRTSDAPEVDTVASFEELFTADGADTVQGGPASELIETDDGNDTVNPAGGADEVFVSGGDDAVDSRDGATDRIFCGEGADTAQVDQFDDTSGCENVTTETVRAAGADLDAPGCTVKRVKRRYSRNAFFRGFRPDVDCDEAATLELALVTTVKRGSFTARVGDLVLAQRTTTAGTNVRVKPGGRFTRALSKRRGIRARLVVEARDEFGNRSTTTKRIKVAKAKRKRRRAGR